MADNGFNTTYNVEAQGNQPQHEDSISDTHNEGNEATPVHGGQYPLYVRVATHDVAEDEHVIQIKLKESLLEFQATTWADIHNWYESNIRIEDDQLGFPALDKGQDRERNKEKSNDDFDIVGGKGLRLFEYNFNVSVVELVSANKNIKEAWFPKSMRFDPIQRDPNLWCKYHGTIGHQTGDCRHLHEEVATLLKNGHLREFLSDRAKNNYGRSHDNMEPSKVGEDPPRLTINMIFGGNEINGVIFSATKKTKVSVTHNKRLREVTEDDITFIEEDADGVLLPHNDALVISLNVLDFKIKHVLVDPGSLANIIQWRVFEQSNLTGSIIPAMKLLVGLNLASATTRGDILLPKNAEGVMKMTLSEVVDGDMGYNIILGRPWLHEMKRLEAAKGKWPEELPGVLWVYGQIEHEGDAFLSRARGRSPDPGGSRRTYPKIFSGKQRRKQ
uniref:Uncharacterized protein n=1 Tax=Nicotiana tabacum TaxID=4097 RepID=A0A1S3ZR38_TOBAC|nr:PREDICTED: uncharacterized protein LOC107789645 [Nicotiana tabacum]